MIQYDGVKGGVGGGNRLKDWETLEEKDWCFYTENKQI